MDETPDQAFPYKTAKGTLFILSKTLVTTIIASSFFVVVARLLPNIADLGLLNSLQVLVAIFAIVGSLGLWSTLTRFMSVYRGEGRQEDSKSVASFIFWVGIGSSSVVSIVVFMLSQDISDYLFHTKSFEFLVQLTAIDIFLISIIALLNSTLFSLQEFKSVATVMIINAIVRYTVGLILLLANYGIAGIMSGYVIGDFITALHFAYITRHYLHPKLMLHISKVRVLMRYAMHIYGSSLFSYLSVNIDYYLLLILTNLTTAGIYSPATYIGMVLIMIMAALDQTLLPHFSTLMGKSGVDSFKSFSRIVSKYLFLIIFPFGFAVLVSVPVIIEGLFGERYSSSIYPTSILVLSLTLTSMGVVFNNILRSAGHSKTFLISNSIALSSQFFVSILLIPVLGALGAAVARGAAYSIMFLYPAYMLKRSIGLDYDPAALRNSLLSTFLMSVVVFILNYFLYEIYLLPFNLLLGLLVYLGSLRLTRAMNRRDFEILESVTPARLKNLLRLTGKIVVR